MRVLRSGAWGGARLLRTVALAAGITALASCSNSSGGDNESESFTVTKAGDRREVNLGTAGPGRFHFEARGFIDKFIGDGEGQTEYVYFYLYSGNNFYYKGAGEGFLYIPYQYVRDDYWCNYGKVKGRSNTPGEWPIEACYVPQNLPWDSTKWYSFDIEWDGSKIYLYVDGVLRNVGTYGSNSLNLIAGMGWPPDNRSGDAVRHIGVVGQEFRNWSFTKK